jgi:DNA repair ATPase RecN
MESSMADQPKYVESLRGEIAVLDHKIEDFNGKFDRKLDDFNEKLDRKLDDFNEKIETLSENLHRVDNSLTEVGTKLETFIQRVDKFADRVWGLFVTGFVLLLGSMATLGASIWQVQQHGKQLEKLEGAITRLDASVAKIPSLEQQIGKLEKSIDKIAGLDATMVRLDQSLAEHGRQLAKLEKSVDKIAGLDIAITRLDGSVTRLANLERTLPELAGSIRENLATSRAMAQRLAAIELHGIGPRASPLFAKELDLAHMKPASREDELVFEWELEPPFAEWLKPGLKIGKIVLPIFTRPWDQAVPTAEVVRQASRTIIRLRAEFPDPTAARAARETLTDPQEKKRVFLQP